MATRIARTWICATVLIVETSVASMLTLPCGPNRQPRASRRTDRSHRAVSHRPRHLRPLASPTREGHRLEPSRAALLLWLEREDDRPRHRPDSRTPARSLSSAFDARRPNGPHSRSGRSCESLLRHLEAHDVAHVRATLPAVL